MRKLILLVALVSISIGVMAQKGKVNSAIRFIDQGMLDRAKTDLDQALVHPKSANLPNTFFAKGRLGQAVFYESENARFRALYQDPLDEALAAYTKAMELDPNPKGQIRRKMITSMVFNELADNFYFRGESQFEAGDFAGALRSFETQIKITESDYFIGGVDAGIYYNTGIAAVNAQNFDAAIKYFTICAEMGDLGITPYYHIYEVNLSKGDTLAAEAVLTALPGLFPDDKSITLQLIDLYIKSGKNDLALKYIADAKRDDPSNSILYFAAGVLYLNEEKYDEAIAELKRSIELDAEEMFDAQYGIGAAYINKAASMYREAETIMDVNQYNAAINAANEVYSNALPFLEKALQLSPDDVYTMRLLKELYYRMGMTEKEDAINARINQIEGN